MIIYQGWELSFAMKLGLIVCYYVLLTKLGFIIIFFDKASVIPQKRKWRLLLVMLFGVAMSYSVIIMFG